MVAGVGAAANAVVGGGMDDDDEEDDDLVVVGVFVIGVVAKAVGDVIVEYEEENDLVDVNELRVGGAAVLSVAAEDEDDLVAVEVVFRVVGVAVNLIHAVDDEVASNLDAAVVLHMVANLHQLFEVCMVLVKWKGRDGEL